MPEASCNERVINVADIDPQYRHAILFSFVRASLPG
jgi:hypothetical protein